MTNGAIAGFSLANLTRSVYKADNEEEVSTLVHSQIA
jgi:hypothetical protein